MPSSMSLSAIAKLNRRSRGAERLAGYEGDLGLAEDVVGELNVVLLTVPLGPSGRPSNPEKLG
jgi:hypothetical protein